MGDSPTRRQKNVYFVQAGNLYGDNAHLPYAAGCIAAYAWNNSTIRENYRLGHFTFLRTPIAQVVASFEDPFMLCFSNYVWNFEYHKALAKAVKERYPDCLVLFGGHQVLNESSRQLDEYPFIDFLIHRAGEIPFENLLLALLEGAPLGGVPSLSYRADGKLLRTGDAPCDSCDFPSPYLAGIFDGLFAEYPSLVFSMTFETNRGCPYQCAFCDWGAAKHAFLLMPMARIEAEINWAARHKIDFVICADANFGILERDEAIVDIVVESKRRTGYPKKVEIGFAKNSNETVFRLNQKLSAHGLNHGATISFQSVSPVVLENIGRKNLDFERFHELISLYNRAGVPVYSDLILGLPGETLESFAHGIGTLLAAGMHGVIEVYPCELLPNAELSNPSYAQKHGIEGIRVRQVQRYGSPKNQDEIPEYSDFVYQTNTMSAADWVSANLFSDVVQAFHCLGLLPYCAVYLYFEQGLAYERFYSDLIAYAKAKPSTLVGELFSFSRERYRAFSQGDGESLVCYDSRFGELTWPLGAIMRLRASFESGRFYDELFAFLQQYTRADPEVIVELIRYQRTMVQMPEPAPPRAQFSYDFHGYFAAAFSSKSTPMPGLSLR